MIDKNTLVRQLRDRAQRDPEVALLLEMAADALSAATPSVLRPTHRFHFRDLPATVPEIVDPRIVYGITCTWWGSIALAEEAVADGPPCCPVCRGRLWEVATRADWDVSAQEAEADDRDGYVAFLEWIEGRCFRSWDYAADRYLEEQGVRVRL